MRKIECNYIWKTAIPIPGTSDGSQLYHGHIAIAGVKQPLQT